LDGTDSTLTLFLHKALADSTKGAIVESVNTTTRPADEHEQALNALADLEVERWSDEGEREAARELYAPWPTVALQREVEARRAARA